MIGLHHTEVLARGGVRVLTTNSEPSVRREGARGRSRARPANGLAAPPAPLGACCLVAATAAAATTAAAVAVLGFVDLDVAAAEVGAVEGADGVLGGTLLRHLHDSEAARAAGLAVRDHGYGLDRAMPTEEILEIRLGAIEGKVADVKFLAQWIGPVRPGS